MQLAPKAPEAGSTAAYAAVGGRGGDVAAAGGAGAVADPRQTGEDPGGAGGIAPAMPVGGMVAGNTGEEVHPVPQPQAGSGGMPKPETGGGGAPAMQPVERVLWSQTWTVALHGTDVRSETEGDRMGLMISAGKGCEFGAEPGLSGETKSYPTNGACISAAISSARGGAAVFSGTDQIAWTGSAELSGWTAAVTGHTVLYLRRTQTYELWLLDNGAWTYDYADFTGTWEAVGY